MIDTAYNVKKLEFGSHGPGSRFAIALDASEDSDSVTVLAASCPDRARTVTIRWHMILQRCSESKSRRAAAGPGAVQMGGRSAARLVGCGRDHDIMIVPGHSVTQAHWQAVTCTPGPAAIMIHSSLPQVWRESARRPLPVGRGLLELLLF